MTASSGRLRGVLLLGGGTVLAAVLGLLFQSLLSYHFGAGAETDAWFMSLSIYAFLAKLLMLTHVKSIAMPAYRRLQAAEPAAAVELERRLVIRLAVGSGLVSVVCVLFAPVLVDVLAPGYTGPLRDLTITLVRIRTPALAFLAVSTGGLIALESASRFGISVSAQKVLPAALMLALFALVGAGSGIVAVGWIGLAGSISGGLLAVAAMASLLRRASGEPLSAEGARAARSALRGVGRQWIRFGGSNAATFVGEWAFRVGASLLPVGLFSAVLYGRMVHDLLHGAVNDSAQAVSLPRFSAASASAEPGHDATAAVGGQLRESLALLSAVTLPLAAFVAATSPWTVALLFGRGRFAEDGMLGPASVALAIFALGFLVQGLVQLGFAAAFASERSALVNRVQIVGHLVRAAALVPAVMLFSYAGLVIAQVGMNVLVAVLLVAMSPPAWRLRPADALRGLGGRTGRALLIATMAAWGAWIVLARLLPDPMAVGTLGRVVVLGGAGALWAVLYVPIALLLGAEPVRRRLRRSRPLVLGSAVLAAAVVLQPGRAHAQEVGEALLPSDHWVRTQLELLEARGLLPVGASSDGPLGGAAAERLLVRAGPLAGEALARLREEAGGRGAWGLTGALSAGVAGRGGVEAGASGGLVGAELRAGSGDARWTAHGSFAAGAARPASVVRAGVGVRLGPLQLQAGRERVQLGGGLVLDDRAALDGVLLTTSEPFGVPALGPSSVTAGIFPMGDYEAVRDPWFALVRFAFRPASWLSVGLSRAALVGGRFDGGTVPWDAKVYEGDTAEMDFRDVVGIVLGQVTGFDDQINGLDVRASLAPVGVPLLLYAETALEDKDRSWGDPAALVGALWSPATRVPLGLRYEYAAFGSPARWCAFCDTLPAFWYQHTRFQSGWRVGEELLGHPLGGYGLQHTLGFTAFDSARRLFLDLSGGRLRRDRWNLREGDRPGGAWFGRGRARWRMRAGLELHLEGELEEGDAGWSGHRVRVRVRWLLPGAPDTRSP